MQNSREQNSSLSSGGSAPIIGGEALIALQTRAEGTCGDLGGGRRLGEQQEVEGSAC